MAISSVYSLRYQSLNSKVKTVGISIFVSIFYLFLIGAVTLVITLYICLKKDLTTLSERISFIYTGLNSKKIRYSTFYLIKFVLT